MVLGGRHHLRPEVTMMHIKLNDGSWLEVKPPNLTQTFCEYCEAKYLSTADRWTHWCWDGGSQ